MAKALQTELASAFKKKKKMLTTWLVTSGKCHFFFFFLIPKLLNFITIFAYYAVHLPEDWMVHVKLHFYVNTFHIWSGLGGMNFVWPEECSMQSEFP